MGRGKKALKKVFTNVFRDGKPFTNEWYDLDRILDPRNRDLRRSRSTLRDIRRCTRNRRDTWSSDKNPFWKYVERMDLYGAIGELRTILEKARDERDLGSAYMAGAIVASFYENNDGIEFYKECLGDSIKPYRFLIPPIGTRPGDKEIVYPDGANVLLEFLGPGRGIVQVVAWGILEPHMTECAGKKDGRSYICIGI